MNNGEVKTNKKLKPLELITIIIVIISMCNFCFVWHHSVMRELLQYPSSGGIRPSAEGEILNTESPQEIAQKEEERKQKFQHHEEVLKKSKPITTGIGIVSLLTLVPLLIIGIIKKNNVVITIFTVSSIVCSLLIVFTT